MNKIKKFTAKKDKVGFSFRCPACNCTHIVYIKGSYVPHWNWNGSMDKPSFSPSIRERGFGDNVDQCHFFIADGKIRYLPDSTHEFGDKIFDMEDIDD